MKNSYLPFLVTVALGLATQTANAATFTTLIEAEDDRGGGTEALLGTFDTFDNLLTGTFADTRFSQLNFGANFSSGGLAYDGQYRLLLEADDDRGAGTEVFMGTFDTYEDLLDGNFSESSFSQLNLGANFSVGGLAYDGQYRLLIESDDDREGGTEVFLGTFNTFDEIIAGTFADTRFSQLNFGANFSAGGLAYDGQYRLLLEADEDRGAGTEVFMGTFDTFDDLLNGTFADGSFSQLNVGPNFSVGGLAYDGFPDDVAPVPLPASMALSLSAFASIGLLSVARRNRSGGAERAV